MRDTMSGSGPWTITLDHGVPTRVEIQTEGRTLCLKAPLYQVGCARCGRPIRTNTPDNDDLDVCAPCEELLGEEFGDGHS